MSDNVKKLIKESFTLPDEGQSNDTVKFSLVGKNIRHNFEKDEKDDWYDGHVVSQVLKPQFTVAIVTCTDTTNRVFSKFFFIMALLW